jgi:hypothetical protein
MNRHDCPLCIEGWEPCGIHPVLGPVFHACTDALPRCRECDGVSLFPANAEDLHEYVRLVANLGYLMEVCCFCLGVTALFPISDGT